MADPDHERADLSGPPDRHRVRARLPHALRGLAGDGGRPWPAPCWRGARAGHSRARVGAGHADRGVSGCRRSPASSLFSRVVVGEWFVASGFFVPENPALGHPWAPRRIRYWPACGARRQLDRRSWRSSACSACSPRGLLIDAGASALVAARAGRRGGAAVGRVPRGAPVPDPLHGAARWRRRRSASALAAGLLAAAWRRSPRAVADDRRGPSSSRRCTAPRRWSPRRSGIGRTPRRGSRSPTCLDRAYDGDDDHGEHGIARALHAGAVARGLRHPRLPPRRQRRHLAERARPGRGRSPAGC